ncbi:hypothetical protein C0989_000991 [Termitomyces sp. Mn162]|nr:hypothetical protein C0989_000991 [Termitomyces sp. Mn162]
MRLGSVTPPFADETDNDNDIVSINDEGDPTDGAIDYGPTGCTDNWKEVAKDEKKKMWAIFEESGIACYLQALKIIETNTVDVNHVLAFKGLSEEDIKFFIDDKQQYFLTLDKEPEDDLHALAYIELLPDLWDFEQVPSLN